MLGRDKDTDPEQNLQMRLGHSLEQAHRVVYLSCVLYGTNAKKEHVRLFVSGTEFSRNVSRVVGSEKNVKTLAFPNTVKDV